MPSIRIGFSTDFNLTSEQVGIGTTRPTARLDVRGQVRSDNASGSGGISTLTEYQGFLHSKQGIGNTVSIAQTTKGNLNSLSGELVISSEVTVSAGTSIGAGRLDSLTVTSSFDLPRGGSTNRPVAPEKGSTRFNQDLGQLEFYTGYEWRTVGSIDGSGRGRGVFAGGPSTIEFINISTTGNALNFGRLSVLSVNVGSCASPTRGIFAGGYVPSLTNIIEYITIASESNSIDFGDLTIPKWNPATASSSTRGVFMGGFPRTNVIDYIEISTIGNALDFGDLFTGRYGATAFASPVRALEAGEDPPGTNIIDFITIASKGNSVRFGVLTERRRYPQGCSNSTRGLFAGGRAPTLVNTIDYVTIATEGDAIDFGDLTVAREYAHSGTASQVRGIFAGGSGSNTIDYVTIASAGNAQDFGDLTVGRSGNAGLSDSHGGLGGF
jgi:hypothetical protein